MYFLSFDLSLLFYTCNDDTRAKTEMVLDQARMEKDQWDRFSALLSMRRNQEQSCKVFLTCMWKAYLICRPSGLHMITQLAPFREWYPGPSCDCMLACM
jgi:hypothetical protein